MGKVVGTTELNLARAVPGIIFAKLVRIGNAFLSRCGPRIKLTGLPFLRRKGSGTNGCGSSLLCISNPPRALPC